MIRKVNDLEIKNYKPNNQTQIIPYFQQIFEKRWEKPYVLTIGIGKYKKNPNNHFSFKSKNYW